MTTASDTNEAIAAGETASIENIRSAPLSISVTSENGCKIELELAPKQILNYTAGDANAMLVLHNADPSCLRIIKPTNVV
jgi:hypothetical protein